MGQVVLVTGVSRYLGGRFARLLTEHPAVDHVIGVDVVPPPHSLGSAEFVRADIRNPIIAKVIARAEVDTVAHLNVIATPLSPGGRVTMKEINVIGTMQLLAACQKASSVRRLVVKSSASVYGSSPRDPAMFTEEMGPKSLPRAGFAKDSIEVEGYVRGFSRRRDDVDVSVLRFANIVGPGISTTLTDYFSLPVVPTVLGFDGRLQLVHEDDALGALLAATVREGVGLVNVAGDGVVTVSQAARLAGRPTVPVPLPASGWLSQVVRRARVAHVPPDHLQHMAFGRVLDTSRMRDVLGFEPSFTTMEAFRSFVASGRGPTPTVLPVLRSALASAQRFTASGQVPT
jgi:UDP-glucose 4-epimerase